jgi:signal transduction histidine kinase
VAVLAATLLSYGIARTVTRPLGTITATMREMSATGDLTRRVPAAPAEVWQDEDARLLAATFNAMTESIAGFQREAAQRERLSALGRLSTVIAHEIRNPLMIIKASLRAFKRDDVKAEQVHTAVKDIEEEVARLNRIVSEVLDFARPINFELAPADLNAICRGAAHAVEADGGRPAVQLTLDPQVPPVVTDAERVRLALVNVLANAQHAAREASGSGASGPPPRVELTTVLCSARRVTVTVRDNGAGIAGPDLPRIFEPYFTTKRTGSGLGLAITKNIIEGLGGSVTARSRPGAGTEIEFDLPLERRT